jgi:hypothetical protein
LAPEAGVALPRGFKASRYDVAIHGQCPACSSNGGRAEGLRSSAGARPHKRFPQTA